MILFIEGFLLLLSGLATFNYWGAIAFHTMAAVRWNSYQFSRLTQIITHSVCMGVPLLLAIIAVSTKSIQATPGAPFAYFRAITPTKLNNSWPEYPLYWGPLLFVVLVVVVCILVVLIPSLQVSIHSISTNTLNVIV